MNPRRLAWTVPPLLLALALPPAPVAEATTTRTLAITNASANPQVPFQAFDGNPPKVFDINGDGRLEIIAQNDNQWAYVFDSLNGNLLSELRTNFPSGWGARTFNGPEVAVLSQGGAVKVVLANSAAVITSYRFNPSQSGPSHFAFTKEWERRLSDCYSNPGMDAKPVLADLDGNGRLDIVGVTEELGVFALRDDGSLLWKKCIGGGNAEPAIGDLNQDGKPDVVFGSDGGVVTAMSGPTGATLWSFNVLAQFNLGSGSMPVAPAIGQLDGAGGPDVVVGARDSHDPENWANDHALLLALRSGGQLLWGRQDPEGNPLTYTRPIIADADGTGGPEVYWGDWNTNGHKPPFNQAQAWQVTGPGRFYRYSAAGELVWRQTLGTWWSNKDVPLADVDGDGVQEMLANGPASNGHDGIWYLDVRDGAKEAFVDAYPWKVQRAPVVADLYGNGQMQWVLAAAPLTSSAGGHAILIYDTGSPYSSVWPHPPYPTAPASPPAPGYFEATFRIKAPNQWWQEVFVEPATPRTIEDVDVRINGGPWKDMTHSSWGAWTSSYNTPAGTQVDFLATDASGGQSQSEPFTWLDGDLEKGSVPPGSPPPSPFNPSFQVSDNVNEWWVEVGVQTSDALSAVHVRVNAGAWTALSATSWGSWAKSMNVPAGSSVQFRATRTDGAQATSETFTWLSGGSFTATFEPCCTDNNWWVEVRVTTSHTLSAVHAHVDGGAWVQLNPTSWGTWAKSFFVPDGASVQFRATDTEGATALSGTYTWG